MPFIKKGLKKLFGTKNSKPETFVLTNFLTLQKFFFKPFFMTFILIVSHSSELCLQLTKYAILESLGVLVSYYGL